MFSKSRNKIYSDYNNTYYSLRIALGNNYTNEDIKTFIEMIDIFTEDDFNSFHYVVKNNSIFLPVVEKINPIMASHYQNLVQDLREAGYFSPTAKKVSFAEIVLPHKMSADFATEEDS